MPKRTRQQEERRLWKSGQANIDERKRTIDENKELQSELKDLRKRYNLVIQNNSQLIHWLQSQPIETLANFSTSVNAIKEKYSISERMSGDFWAAVWNIPVSDAYKSFRGWNGMPGMRFNKDLKHELVITPETDITNEFVLVFIKAWQKTMIEHDDKPPQPQKPVDSKRLDWSPVWEWGKRHPQITRKEIAVMLGRPYTVVKSKLEELDKQAEDPLLFSFQK